MRDRHREDPSLSVFDDSVTRQEFVRRAALTGVAVFGASALGAAPTARAAYASDASAEHEAARASKTLKLVAPGDLVSADPAFSSSYIDNWLQHCVFEGLIGAKPSTTWGTYNQLAESWGLSKDGRQLHFKLKQGVQFHHGYGELTAEDVKFSFERIAGILKPNINSAFVNDWSELQQVKVTGKYTGVIILKRAYAPLLTTTLPYIAGMVVSKKAVEKLGKKFAHQPVGTGPYQFTSWVPQQKTVLTRFPQWHGHPKPGWSEIVFLPISDTQTTNIAVQSGEADAAQIDYNSSGLFKNKSGFGYIAVPTVNFAWIGMNVRHPNFSDLNVRRAVRYALDVPSMLAVGYGGAVQQAYSIIAPGMPVGYWKNAPHYQRDLDKAKAYLAKATNPPKNVTFTAYLSKPGSKAISQVAQSNLRDLGINATIELLQNEESGKQNRNHQIFYAHFGGTAPDPVNATEWFRCDQLDQWNFNYWCNKTFDRLDRAAVLVTDKAKRNQMYIQEQKLWDQSVNTVWLTWPPNPWAWRATVKPAFYPWGDPVPWAFRAA